MADRFPLIVNAISKKIEEIVSGDNLELTGNGIVVSGDTGAGKYLSSDGNTVFWDSPGDVYLTQTQTLLDNLKIQLLQSKIDIQSIKDEINNLYLQQIKDNIYNLQLLL